MNRGGRLFRAKIRLADTDRHRYATRDTDLAQHLSETDERVILRLLAYLLFHQDRLAFRGGGVSEGDAPDLAATDATGRLVHWIDVGTPDEVRLRRAARRCRVSVLTHTGLLSRWKRRHKGRLPLFEGELLALEASLIDTLTDHLPRRLEWQATLTGEVLYLDTGERVLSSPLLHPK